MIDGAGKPTTGLRSRQKAERQALLIRAARDLLEEQSDSGFSMARLADRAGLSLATPYNLFGSKAAILHAVFEADVASLNRAVANQSSSGPVHRALATSDLLSRAVTRKPQYYRALARSLAALGSAETQRMLVPMRDTILVGSLQAIEQAGLLRPVLPISAVATQFARHFESCFLHWAALDWNQERLTAELRMGTGLLLLGILTDEGRAEVEAALSALQMLPSDEFIYNAL